jgi:hypothetical protein
LMFNKQITNTQLAFSPAGQNRSCQVARLDVSLTGSMSDAAAKVQSQLHCRANCPTMVFVFKCVY